jgi:hypothetical protein
MKIKFPLYQWWCIVCRIIDISDNVPTAENQNALFYHCPICNKITQHEILRQRLYS